MNKSKLKLLIKQFFCNHNYKNPIFDVKFKDLTPEMIRDSNFVCTKCNKEKITGLISDHRQLKGIEVANTITGFGYCCSLCVAVDNDCDKCSWVITGYDCIGEENEDTYMRKVLNNFDLSILKIPEVGTP